MFQSFNPYTNKVLKKYTLTTNDEVNTIIASSHQSYLKWRAVTLNERCKQIQKLGELLLHYKERAALLITQEMGKPIAQSRNEIVKCADLCDFYATHAESYLKNKTYNTNFESFVTYEPLGVILGIMPWNFPFWQVFRFAIPTLLAGNTVLLKHAPNVPDCVLFMADLFAQAIGVENAFQYLFLDNSATQNLIGNPIIKGVSLTGSTQAGKAVASEAGKHLKPVILELGGSNAFIVFEDADINQAVAACIRGRFNNNGQSCIAVKRLLVHESLQQVFTEKLLTELNALKKGNPLDEDTFFSVLADQKFSQELQQKLEVCIAQGAELLCGGKSKDAFFEPTIVTNVSSSMAIFKEETFGPLLPVVSFTTVEEAIAIANDTDFGLGVSLFTNNRELVNAIISKFDDGAVVVNDFVKSYPNLPFGGTKISGLGRELSEEGIKAFTNTKTVVIK